MGDHIDKTIAVYNSIAPSYAQKVKELAPEQERQKFVALLHPKAKLLDVGCAAGRDSLYFTQKNLKVTGIDLSEKLLEYAKITAPQATFLKEDVRYISFPSESFDGIWVNAVLLHLKRQEIPEVLAKFYQLLRKSGVLFVSLKKGKGEGSITEPLSQEQPRFFTFYEESEIKQLITQTGFSIIELYTRHAQDRGPDTRNIDWIFCFARKV